MDDPNAPATGDPAAVPGERRLARPPSDRYRATAPSPSDAGGPPTDAPAESGKIAASPARGIAFAVVAAIGVAAAITIAGGVFLVSAGLIVVAAAGGWAVAIALRAGAGPTIPRASRRWLAGGLALAGILFGQLGLWLFARSEGGVLPLIDYLGQTFGPIVLVQAVVGPIVAAWSAR